jgi:uncharacterized protein DUF6519
MKSDISRNTFDPAKHFSRVIMQQGRVQLDADWNEQADILLHYLRTLAADLIGAHGGPESGFEIVRIDGNDDARKHDFAIGQGHYYVDGILCENAEQISYSQHRGISSKDKPFEEKSTYLVYLDVWERHITYLEDEDGENPSIREVALGGPDTATRSKVVWRVVAKKSEISETMNDQGFTDALGGDRVRRGTGRLRARALKAAKTDDTDPCLVSPEARYRGVENQLYRVEIHNGGPAGDATFKWSRENGSVVFPLRKSLVVDGQANTTVAVLEHLGRDGRLTLTEGDWVEIADLDDDAAASNQSRPLLQVASIDRDEQKVTLQGSSDPNIGKDLKKHPLLRRWDHKEGTSKSNPNQTRSELMDGAVKIVEPSDSDEVWFGLENGVQIQFQRPPNPDVPNQYRRGDYWLIPARTATGDVEWPGAVGQPDAVRARGVEHHYAPLARVLVANDGALSNIKSFRRPM